MPNIKINEILCNKCNTCAKVCTFGIITPADKENYPSIALEKQAYCFKCGHCEAFCKVKALRLDCNQMMPQISYKEDSINSDNLSIYMKNRRSIRLYQPKAVEKEVINKLMDTVRYGATGGNSQDVQYLMFYKKEDVKAISRMTIDFMKSIIGTKHPMANYVSGVVQAWDNGLDLISHEAPHLLLAHIPHSEYFYDHTDAIIALTHFDLIAPAYGVGTCWAGFVKMAYSSSQEMQDFIALPKNRDFAYPMLFGYPIFKPVNVPERNPVSIEWR